MTRLSRILCLLLLSIPLAGCSDTPLGFGLALDGHPITQNAVTEAGEPAGWPVSMVVFFLQWPEDKQPNFPQQSVEAIARTGAVPVITWEPMFLRGGEEFAIPTLDIFCGEWDSYIDAFARAARDSGHRIILRFAHEMNLERYHWGGTPSEYGPESPARYKELFRHVRERFRIQGADNVLFAFCPNAESLPHPQRDRADWNTASAYYPGDDAVDVLGMDGYNWGTTFTKAAHGWDSRFTPFKDIFSAIRSELKALAPDRPLVVFETASVSQGGDKTAWIEDAMATAKGWGLAGVCWFEVRKEQDWRMESGTDTARLKGLAAGFVPDGTGLALPAATGGIP